MARTLREARSESLARGIKGLILRQDPEHGMALQDRCHHIAAERRCRAVGTLAEALLLQIGPCASRMFPLKRPSVAMRRIAVATGAEAAVERTEQLLEQA